MKLKPKKTGFSFEDEENLDIILNSDTWPTLLKFLGQLQTQFERGLVQYNLSEGADKLVQEKARVEGSARLITELKKFREMRKGQAQKAATKP